MITLKTNRGDIVIELDKENAPDTCENFVQYVKAGHFDGTIFHRVISNFMIQGGGFSAGMIEKPTRAPIRNEAQNGLSNLTGTIAMARTNDPHSATAQFFINVADNKFLDHPGHDGWGYCVFGKVTAGMDVVNDIKRVETGSHMMHQDVPKEDIVIETAVVDE
jgi:peptidyl-prolyl cis-trans isomerase B (cyclophilin B)